VCWSLSYNICGENGHIKICYLELQCIILEAESYLISGLFLITHSVLLETIRWVSLLYKAGLKKDIPFKFSLWPFKCQLSTAAGALFNLIAHCETVFSHSIGKVVYWMGQPCATCPWNVNLLEVYIYTSRYATQNITMSGRPMLQN